MRRLLFAIGLLLVVPGMAGADEAQSRAATDNTDATEPEVTIIQSDGKRVEEYRVNGQLYMIKVTPRKGPPYYLVDTDGDGVLETRRNDLASNMLTPQWILFRWK